MRPVLRLFVLSVIATLAMAGDEWYHETRELYAGIPVTVRFTPADAELATRVWTSLASVDAVYNDWNDTSEIGRINAGGAGEYTLSPDLAEAFELSGRARTATSGAFEPTVGPLRRLWRGAEKAGRWPGEAEIAAARAAVGPDAYSVEGTRLKVLKAGVKFDFGGVCKGMAVDRAVAILQAARRSAGMVQVGGETGCWGTAPAGRPHRLGIPHPDAPDDPERIWTRLQDPGEGMCGSTSGNYRNPIIIDGRICYHIYDPRTALPTDTHVLSVSVAFAGTGHNGLADSLTKAGVVLGPPGLELIERAGGQAMMLVREADGRISEHATSGWKRFVHSEGAKP